MKKTSKKLWRSLLPRWTAAHSVRSLQVRSPEGALRDASPGLTKSPHDGIVNKILQFIRFLAFQVIFEIRAKSSGVLFRNLD